MGRASRYARLSFQGDVEHRTRKLRRMAYDLVQAEQQYGGEMRRVVMHIYEEGMRSELDGITEQLGYFLRSAQDGPCPHEEQPPSQQENES